MSLLSLRRKSCYRIKGMGELMGKFICDDRDVLENIIKLRNMTDEEFEEYINKMRESQTDE